MKAVDGSKRPSSIMGAGNMRESETGENKHTGELCSTRDCESSHQQASPVCEVVVVFLIVVVVAVVVVVVVLMVVVMMAMGDDGHVV